MKIADVQILFYAIDPTAEHHETAARWLEEAINDRERLGLTWSTIHQFLRLGTNPRFTNRMADDEAQGWIAEWLREGVQIVSDADMRWELFAELVEASERSLRNAIDDAHLAAVAISRGATLASFDRDFDPFVGHGLRWEWLGRPSR